MVREDRKSTIKIEQGGRVEEGARGQKWNSRSMREWLKSGSGENEGGEKNERNDEWKKDEEEF